LKVVHVVVAGDIGGAERMVADLAARPRATGVGHAVATMSPNPRLVRLLRDAGLRVHDRGAVREGVGPYLWRSLGPTDVSWLAQVLAEERARLVHLHTFGSQVIGTRAAIAVGARVVRTEHSTRVYGDPSCWPFSRWSLVHADAVVAVSAHVGSVALLKAPWLRGKLRVVHDGVDVARFAPRDVRREGGAAFRFIAVGRLEPRKGHDLAIDALADVPGAALDIVGDGLERPRLEVLARRRGVHGRVVFHGYLDDPREVMAMADAMVCSSREEGLGIALLEGMAMERPVVTFAVGGVPESVRDAETGWITAANTATALAARMREAMVDRATGSTFGRRARQRVTARFSVERMCAGYAEVYASLGDRPAHGASIRLPNALE
jgi:glycosyltransferase involved in cell wall biosynthesis